MKGPRRWFLLGPTASGKSDVALELAPRLDAEILSLDSMLVYRGMDIGTAKPGPAERARVAHHLLDLVAPSEAFSASRWVAAAVAAEEELALRGKNALYVGGTALYLKSLLHGLPQGRAIPPEVREALRREAQQDGGPQRLRAELERVDPVAAARIHPRDAQRLLRALEHARAFGEPWSAAWAPWPRSGLLGAPALAVRWPRKALHERIALRFERMLDAGLLEEVLRIRASGGFGPTARGAIGYRHLLKHLQQGGAIRDAIADALRDTRVLVRRQETWLRSFPDVGALDAGAAGGNPAVLAEEAARRFSAAE
jgi:tRNA dimethylallyltransferase